MYGDDAWTWGIGVIAALLVALGALCGLVGYLLARLL
jgi:hypothetical protein